MTQIAHNRVAERRRLLPRRNRPSPSLATRMLAASALVALLVAGGFGILIHAVATLDEATDQEAHAQDMITSTLMVEKLVLDLETGSRGFVLSGNDRFLQPWDRARTELPGRLQSFERLASRNPAQRRLAQRLAIAIRDYVDFYSVPLVNLARQRPAAARAPDSTAEGKRQTDEIRGQFVRFRDAVGAISAQSATDARSQSDRAIRLAVAGLVACALLVVLFGLYLARSTARPVRAAATAATRLAGGDYTTRLDEDGPGEVGALTASFNRMAEDLERRRTELEAQNAKLRESESRKSELVAIVSHELRTPLASVLGFTSVLLRREVAPEEQRRYLEIIDTEGRRLSSLLNDFLDAEKLEEGQLDLTPELMDLGGLVRQQANLFAGQSAKHVLEVSLPPQPLPVCGDRNRLAQVLANMLSNAIKYSPEGGTVEIVGERDDDVVRVSVRDEGLGIPEDLQKRVFAKFFRGDAGASGIPGTGLGLTIARSVVEAHGGRIDFESTSGKGAIFWIELPIAAAAHDVVAHRKE